MKKTTKTMETEIEIKLGNENRNEQRRRENEGKMLHRLYQSAQFSLFLSVSLPLSRSFAPLPLLANI